MPSAQAKISAALANIGYRLLLMSGVGLHVFTAITAYNLVDPGMWRYIATVAAIAYPVIAQMGVAYFAWRESGSMINSYSVWLLAWILLLWIVLLLRALRNRFAGN
jgi:uncharacterized membrane protein SirB2